MENEITIKRAKLGSALRLVVAAAVAMVAGTAAAETIVHVTGTTYGCVKPKVALLLAKPEGAGRADPGWLARTIVDGQCVAITPLSPWEPVSNDAGGETLLEYRGTTARPGTYWVPTTAIAYPVPDTEARNPSIPAPTPTIALPAKPIVPPKPAPATVPKPAPEQSPPPPKTVEPLAAASTLAADSGRSGECRRPSPDQWRHRLREGWRVGVASCGHVRPRSDRAPQAAA